MGFIGALLIFLKCMFLMSQPGFRRWYCFESRNREARDLPLDALL